MDGDLVVQRDVLETTASSLSLLAGSFERLDRRTELSGDDWGSADLAAAFRRFADDWDDRRSRLVGKMRDVEQMARDCAREFARVDGELSQVQQ